MECEFCGRYKSGFRFCSDQCYEASRWTPPLQEMICEECDGSGEIAFATVIYEPGCTHSHESSDARPCERCGGYGWIADEAEAKVFDREVDRAQRRMEHLFGWSEDDQS